MIVQYPSILKFKSSSTDSVYNQDTGEWSEAVKGQELEIVCREEMNSKGEVVKSNDGADLDYSYTIYMKVDAPVFQYGQLIEVVNGDGIIIKDAVKKFSRGQLNARLWV